jgi:hypothetical protein
LKQRMKRLEDALAINWLQVLDTTELPQINQCVRH